MEKKKRRLNKFECIYLARIVEYDRCSILFEINDLKPNYEDYRLVKMEPKDWAYDLLTYKRYKVLNVIDGIISSDDLDKIKPNLFYVYDTCSFIDMWYILKEVFDVKEDLEAFLEKCLSDINELNKILSPENKVIDFNRVKSLTNRRKY